MSDFVPLDTYIRIVLGVKDKARKLMRRPSPADKKMGLAISEDMQVLIDNLKNNGHIE